jgi:hypothetical protein
MKAVIVDENVTIVANDVVRVSSGQAPKAPQADDMCRLSTIRRLRTIMRQEKVIVDASGTVIGAYRRYLSGTGQPGLGDVFFKWVCDHLYDADRVERIELGLNDDGTYSAFPDDPRLANFDRADRVFVALALECPAKPQIINAVDSDYYHHMAALQNKDVSVEELCGHCLKMPPTI